MFTWMSAFYSYSVNLMHTIIKFQMPEIFILMVCSTILTQNNNTVNSGISHKTKLDKWRIGTFA